MHAPAACLKTPGLFAFSPAELRHSRVLSRERACYPPPLRFASFSSHVLFSSITSVFSGRRVTRKQAPDSSCQTEANAGAAGPGDQRQNAALGPSPRQQRHRSGGVGGNEQGLSKRCHRPTSCLWEHTHTRHTHTQTHTHSLSPNESEPDSVISQRFSLTPGVSLPSIKFPSDLYVNVGAKKTR